MTDLVPRPSSPAHFIDEWERQPGEPPRAWKAFQLFRELGEERGVYAVRDKAGFQTSYMQLTKWADRHRWLERAAAWDRMLDRQRQRAHIEATEEMARRQVEIGQLLSKWGTAYVQEQLDTYEKREEKLSPTSALRFIDKGVELEREGLGMNKNESVGDTNVTVNILEAGAKADVFDKIDEMASNFATMRDIVARNGAPDPADILDAELAEDDDEIAL